MYVTTKTVLIVSFVAAIAVCWIVLSDGSSDTTARWAVVAASLAVIAAVISAWTGVNTVELQRKAQQPFVVSRIDATSRYGLLQLEVRNTGGSVARNIKLVWDKPLLDSEEKAVVFHNTDSKIDILSLLPDESNTILIDGVTRFYEKRKSTDCEGRIHWEDATGKKYSESIFLNLEAHRMRLHYEEEAPRTHYELQKLPRLLQQIVKILKESDK